MTNRASIPAELTNVAEVQKNMQNDVERLKEQHQQAYTKERATDFRADVKDIILETLESTETYKKVSDKVQGQINTTLAENSWKFKTLWAPIIVSALVSIIGIVVAIWLAGRPKL